MDLISPRILTSLAVRAVTGSVGAARTARQSARTLAAVADLQRADSEAGRYILTAVAELQSVVASHHDIALVGRFLRSAEADVVVRSVAISMMTRELEHARQDMLDELTAMLVLVGRMSTRTARTASGALLQIFIGAMSQVASHLQAVAPQEYGAFVDRAILEKNAGYLRYMSHRAEIFRERTPAEYKFILEFCAQYREQVRRGSSELVPAYFDIQRRAPIEAIYVDPRVGVASSTGRQRDGQLDFRALVEESYRPVVLGDPGAGKSTLAQRIAYYYAGDEAGERNKFTEIVPIVIPLRVYDTYTRTRMASMPEFIYDYISEKYHLRPPAGSIEYLLAAGRALVIFDGLDELLDMGRRQHVCSVVESFAALFATAPIVCTSRRVGYLEAPLRPSVFEPCILQPFTDDDILKYVTEWFGLDDRLAVAERQKMIKTFMDESMSVPDIRSNPLMLGLLCNVYKGSREIPQNRAELYEKCAVMLFEQWDSGRGIARSGVLKADVRAALQDVALWVYTTPDLADGVPERSLLLRLQSYWSRRFEDPDDALAAAKTLLAAWKGRSWILTEVGGSAETRQPIYRFTHRTFLEYFASVELTKRHPSPDDLWQVLEGPLRAGTWEIVAQLAIQRLNEFYADAGDEITKRLTAQARRAALADRIALLGFATRNLDSLYATTSTIRELASEAVDLSLVALPSVPDIPETWDDYAVEVYRSILNHHQEREVDTAPDRTAEQILHDDEIHAKELIGPLQELASDHGEAGRLARDTVARHLERLMLDDADPDGGARSFAVAASAHLLVAHDSAEGAESLRHHLDDVIRRAATGARIQRWSTRNFWVPVVACRLGLIGVDTAVRLGGWRVLLCGAGPFEESLPALAEDVVLAYVAADRPQTGFEAARSALRHVGRQLSGDSNPAMDRDWIGATSDICVDLVMLDFGARRPPEERDHRPEPDEEVAFGAAFLMALFVELERPSVLDYSDDQIADLRLGPIRGAETVFTRRLLSYVEVDVESLAELVGDGAQLRLLLAWAARDVDFVRFRSP